MPPRRAQPVLRTSLALAASVALTAACGAAAPVATAATPVPVGPLHALILVSAFKFDTQLNPQVVPDTKVRDILRGQVVTWFNQDGSTHHVSSGTPPTKDGKFDGEVPAKGMFEFTFNDAGTFPYFCAIHNSMTGTIVVK
jgi:plastocyanin